jgi:cephalosporin-C deacetylase-like acetyl esterase
MKFLRLTAASSFALLLLLQVPLGRPLHAQAASSTAKQTNPPQSTESPFKILTRAERDSALYRRGEKVTFHIEVSHKGHALESGELDWALLKDGLPLNREGKAAIQSGRATVEGQLDEPGFLQLRLTYRPAPPEKSITALAGAGIDCEQIVPSLPVPDDFEAFWNAQKAELAKIPIAPQLTHVESTNGGVEIFDLQAPTGAAPVSGYLARPAGARHKSLPIILTVHGAGVRGSSLGAASGWASKGFLAMDMNAHGLPNGKPDNFYKEQNDGPLRDYRYMGRESREHCYFKEMFLRLVRAIDVLTAQPEWDGKTVVVFGGSQGGYQAIVASGLDSRVTFFCAGVPAGCDHSGMKANRIAGWPKLVALDPERKPDPKGLDTARYFDAMNFAQRSKAAGAFFTVGFIDTTCPPTSVYAAYNGLQIPKAIFNDILSGHANSAQASEAMRDAVLKHVAAQKNR